MANKWVYMFSEGDMTMRNLLGGKGANLAEMTSIGLPVPQGFTITTEACTQYYEDGRKINDEIMAQAMEGVKKMEEINGKKFGDLKNPLLVSVRSGARASMPGMMDTILNLGLNEDVVNVLAEKSGNARWAWDCYRRFIQMYSDVVMEVGKKYFEKLIDEMKEKKGVKLDVELDADENGNLKDWYLNNWREGEDIAEVLKNLTGEKTDQEDAWKSVYLNYIETNTQIEDPEKGTHREIYKLLDLNEDGVPELYINFGSTAGGDAILSYFNGEIVEQKMDNYGFRYIEGANLFRDSGGHMDEYYDKIYTLENGNFVLLYSGEYGAEDNSKVEYGDDGMPVYQYFWENEEVSSEEEYDRKLNEVYDTEKEVNIFLDAQYDSGRGRYVGNGLCDYQEITEAIEAY